MEMESRAAWLGRIRAAMVLLFCALSLRVIWQRSFLEQAPVLLLCLLLPAALGSYGRRTQGHGFAGAWADLACDRALLFAAAGTLAAHEILNGWLILAALLCEVLALAAGKRGGTRPRLCRTAVSVRLYGLTAIYLFYAALAWLSQQGDVGRGPALFIVLGVPAAAGLGNLLMLGGIPFALYEAFDKKAAQ